MANTDIDIVEPFDNIFTIGPASFVVAELSDSDLEVLGLFVPSNIMGNMVEFYPRFYT